MKVLVIIPNKDKKDELVLAALDYLSKLKLPYCASHIFIDVGRKFDRSDAKLKMQEEGKAILQATDGYFRIALDLNGKKLDSSAFSSWLSKLSFSTSKISFIIGGAFGLSEQVLTACDAKISLSDMTFPHKLALLMLSEQIYRAAEINFGSPYHK